MKGEWEWKGLGGSGVIEGKKFLFFSHFLVPDCRCTQMSHLYPIVAVPVCRTTCTRLSLYPTVAYPCTRLSLYPTVANFCTRLSLYPTVASVPVCHCTQLSLYPTVAVPNCPRTRLTWTRQPGGVPKLAFLASADMLLTP